MIRFWNRTSTTHLYAQSASSRLVKIKGGCKGVGMLEKWRGRKGGWGVKRNGGGGSGVGERIVEEEKEEEEGRSGDGNEEMGR